MKTSNEEILVKNKKSTTNQIKPKVNTIDLAGLGDDKKTTSETNTNKLKINDSEITKKNNNTKTKNKNTAVVNEVLQKAITNDKAKSKKTKNNQIINVSNNLDEKVKNNAEKTESTLEKKNKLKETKIKNVDLEFNTELPQKEKRVRTRFENLSKSNKTLTIVNLSLNAILLGLCLSLMIIFGINGDPENRMLSCVFMFVLALIPFLAELIFRFRFNPTVYLFYIIYIYIAGLWGSCLNGYGKVWWLDIAIHFFFGYVGGLIALLFLCKTKEISKLKLLSIIVICFSISMTCGAMWEIAEFIGDTMFNQTAQGFPINGITAITDTMEDIVCNFGGAVLFCIHYLLYKVTNKNLGMGYIENDFNTKV